MSSASDDSTDRVLSEAELIDAAVEGLLSEADADRLETLLLTNEAFRDRYIDAVDLHASLVLGAETHFASELSTPLAKPSARSRLRFGRHWRSVVMALGVAIFACGYLLGNAAPGSLLHLSARPQASDTIATLIDTKLCSWGPTDTATRASSRLAPGTLRLRSGLASLRFDQGMEITLEGDTTFFAQTRNSAVMTSGTILCDGSRSTSPFYIHCADAEIELERAKLAVAIRLHRGELSVDVLSGSVTVRHRQSQQLTVVSDRQLAIVRPDELILLDKPEFEAGFSWDATASDSTGLEAEQVITTAQGRGEDAFVMHSPIPLIDRPQLLLVKHSEADAIYRRKAYVRMDLAALPAQSIREAELRFTVQSSGLGYAAETPDSEFEVYGLADEELDDWRRATLNWDNAPGNDGSGDGVDLTAARLLGRFVVPQGMQHGVVSIRGAELVRFLTEDSNGLATFIVVRKTTAHQAGMVHAFGSKRLAPEAAPQLRLWFQ